MEAKICTKCKIPQEFNKFGKDKMGKNGLNSICKNCIKLYNRERTKKGLKSDSLSYYYNNIDKVKTQRKIYYENNKQKIKEYIKSWRNKKRKNDDFFRLSSNIRSSIGSSFRERNLSKTSKTVNILGCSIQELRIHIEEKWESWMNWGNYALYNGELNYGWDLDHIIPISTAKTKEDLIRLNHYTNLQFLCSYTNKYIKRNKS